MEKQLLVVKLNSVVDYYGEIYEALYEGYQVHSTSAEIFIRSIFISKTQGGLPYFRFQHSIFLEQCCQLPLQIWAQPNDFYQWYGWAWIRDLTIYRQISRFCIKSHDIRIRAQDLTIFYVLRVLPRDIDVLPIKKYCFQKY